MKVAQVIGRYTGGGAGRSALNLAMGLNEIGVGSVCIALREHGGYADLDRSGLPVFALGAHRGSLACVQSLHRLRRLIAAEQVDVLHTHAPLSLLFASLATFGMRPRPRLCFTWHDPVDVLEERRLSNVPLIAAMRRADNVFCCSGEIRGRLDRTFGRRYGRQLCLLHNGVPARKQSTEIASEPPALVWAARMNPTKDPHILLRACKRLRQMGLCFRVILAGDAPPHAQAFVRQTQAMISEFGLGDCTEWLGWQHDLSPVYARAAIGVQTSHAEGLSMTLLEEMMAGLAIVATDTGGTREAICDSETGLIVPPGDEEALVVALRRLICDGGLRVRLAAAARAAAVDRFSLSAMARVALDGYAGHGAGDATGRRTRVGIEPQLVGDARECGGR